MKDRRFEAICLALALACTWVACQPATAQLTPVPAPGSNEEQIVAEASAVLEKALTTPGSSIPRNMLAGAEGVAIVPRVIKGGFIVGARHGRGVVVTKDSRGVWHAPIFLTLTGGNVGWQAGVQSTDVVLVYKTQRSIDSLMSGKLTIGADVAAAAGPVGVNAAAATDSSLKAEVYSYSLSRGLFVGAALDGSVLKIDHAATSAYYRPATPGGPAATPPEAHALTARIVSLAMPEQQAAPPEPTAAQAAYLPRAEANELAAVRDQLADAAPRLFRQLDPAWQQHLALPAEIFRETGHASPETIDALIVRYDTIALEPQYANLAGRPEFQSVHALLRHYGELVANRRPTLQLPPPPQ